MTVNAGLPGFVSKDRSWTCVCVRIPRGPWSHCETPTPHSIGFSRSRIGPGKGHSSGFPVMLMLLAQGPQVEHQRSQRWLICDRRPALGLGESHVGGTSQLRVSRLQCHAPSAVTLPPEFTGRCSSQIRGVLTLVFILQI